MQDLSPFGEFDNAVAVEKLVNSKRHKKIAEWLYIYFFVKKKQYVTSPMLETNCCINSPQEALQILKSFNNRKLLIKQKFDKRRSVHFFPTNKRYWEKYVRVMIEEQDASGRQD